MKLIILILFCFTFELVAKNNVDSTYQNALVKLKQHEIFTLITKDKKIYEGSIVYANDSIMLFIEKGKLSDLEDVYKHIVKLHFSNIDTLILEKDGNLWIGAGVGAILGIAGGAIIVATSKNRDSEVALVPMAIGFFAAPFVYLGGIVGAILDIDSKYNINGKEVEYLYYLKDFQEKSIYGNNPSPEILQLMK